MDLKEVGGVCGDWMELAQDRDRWRALVSTVRNLRVPKMPGISWLAAEPDSFSRRTLLHGVSKYYITPVYLHKHTVLPAGAVDRERIYRFSKTYEPPQILGGRMIYKKQVTYRGSAHFGRSNPGAPGTRDFCVPNLCISYDCQNKRLLL